MADSKIVLAQLRYAISCAKDAAKAIDADDNADEALSFIEDALSSLKTAARECDAVHAERTGRDPLGVA